MNGQVFVARVRKPAKGPIQRAVANELQSDLHEYTVGPKNMPMKPHVLTGETAPSIMGSSVASFESLPNRGQSLTFMIRT